MLCTWSQVGKTACETCAGERWDLSFSLRGKKSPISFINITTKQLCALKREQRQPLHLRGWFWVMFQAHKVQQSWSQPKEHKIIYSSNNRQGDWNRKLTAFWKWLGWLQINSRGCSSPEIQDMHCLAFSFRPEPLCRINKLLLELFLGAP